jgi:hypothetical protein
MEREDDAVRRVLGNLNFVALEGPAIGFLEKAMDFGDHPPQGPIVYGFYDEAIHHLLKSR